VYDGKSFIVFTKNGGKPFTDVWSIIEDRQGNIWLGGRDGLWRYDGRTCSNFKENSVRFLYQDKKGNIWTSGASNNGNGFGLSRYEEKSLSDKKPTVTQINPAYAEYKGMIWVIAEMNDGSI
jgi:ligand-binding sensor domain-containing protein